MDYFRFAHPGWLILFFIPIILLWMHRQDRIQWQPLEYFRFSDIRLFNGLPSSWRVKALRILGILRWTAWSLLVVAMARPQSGNGMDVIRGQGVDIVLTVDISSSMAALDFDPENRLEATKTVIGDFILQREFDRIGLVVFARNAYHQAPLTLNYPVLVDLLNRVQLISTVGDIDGRQLDGTALGSGLASAANMLRTSDAASKVIILLTDGDSNAGLDPILSAEAAAALGIRIYTIGMGSTGMTTIPTREGSIVEIESDLDEETLREIATIGDGLYFRAEDTLGLQQIYSQIDRLERSNVERRVFIQWQDRVVYVLALALILIMLELILQRTLFRSLP